MKKYFSLFGISLWFSIFNIYPQKSSLPEVQLSEIKISAYRNIFFKEDKKIFHFDSLIFETNKHLSLGEVLNLATGIAITQNSPNGISSILLRGTSANHTSVQWNGLNINSLTTGAADLSIIPVDAADQISITEGAAASLYGSGNFGGAIDLNSVAEWNNRLTLKLSTEYGSFENLKNAISLKIGNAKCQYHFTFLNHFAKNNFSFFDSYKFGNPKVSQTHNETENQAILQSIFCLLPNNQRLESGLWLQKKSTNIPAIMGSYQESSQEQTDKTLKFYLKYSFFVRQKNSFSLKNGFLQDFLYFSDKNSKIDSKFLTKKFLTNLEYTFFYSKNFIFDINIDYKYLNADISAYQKLKTEHQFGFSTGAKWTTKICVTNFSLRQEFYEKNHSTLLFSIGSKFEIVKEKLFSRINFANQFRNPTFNEKYWEPGGNPNIKPEKGWNFEIAKEYFFENNKNCKLFIDLTAYYSTIYDFIQWIPKTKFWSPENVKTLIIKGIENSIHFDVKFSKIFIKTSANYRFTISETVENYDKNLDFTGKQSIYVPIHSFQTQIYFSYKNFYLSYNQTLTGKRFTTADNNEIFALPFYSLSDISLGKTLIFKKLSVDFQFKTRNIFNVSYQIIRAYAMPLRNYSFRISFMFHNKNS